MMSARRIEYTNSNSSSSTKQKKTHERIERGILLSSVKISHLQRFLSRWFMVYFYDASQSRVGFSYFFFSLRYFLFTNWKGKQKEKRRKTKTMSLFYFRSYFHSCQPQGKEKKMKCEIKSTRIVRFVKEKHFNVF